jgi:hypothetical protein
MSVISRITSPILSAVSDMGGDVIDGVVGLVDRAKRYLWVARLAAGQLFRPLSQAAGAWRLLGQPVTGRQIAAVRTVQPQAALQLRHPCQQRCLLTAHRLVFSRKRRPFAGKHRIQSDQLLYARP